MPRRDMRSETDEAEAPESAAPPPRTLEDLAHEVRGALRTFSRRCDGFETRFATMDTAEKEAMKLKLQVVELKSEAWKARGIGWGARVATALGGLILGYAVHRLEQCMPTAPPMAVVPIEAPSAHPVAPPAPSK